jgi:hypothetical protein
MDWSDATLFNDTHAKIIKAHCMIFDLHINRPTHQI